MIKSLIQSCLAVAGLRLTRIRPREQVFPAINILRLAITDALHLHLASGRGLDTFWAVQIGAHDGVSFDPVREYITSYKFPALLVEPQPDIFARLKENYRGFDNVVLENTAVAHQDGTMTLYRFAAGPDTPYEASCLASWSKEVLERNPHGMSGKIEEIQVPGTTLSGLLKKHAIQTIGLLQIDTEGFDFDVIKMVDFSRYKPAIINLEDGFLDRTERTACFTLLCQHGYRILRNGIDIVAYQQEEQDEFAARKIVTTLAEPTG
jgi:FkbM family methyltransferase